MNTSRKLGLAVSANSVLRKQQMMSKTGLRLLPPSEVMCTQRHEDLLWKLLLPEALTCSHPSDALQTCGCIRLRCAHGALPFCQARQKCSGVHCQLPIGCAQVDPVLQSNKPTAGWSAWFRSNPPADQQLHKHVVPNCCQAVAFETGALSKAHASNTSCL